MECEIASILLLPGETKLLRLQAKTSSNAFFPLRFPLIFLHVQSTANHRPLLHIPDDKTFFASCVRLSHEKGKQRRIATGLQRVLTMSSIFMRLRTVSAARVMALVDTSRGCTTFSSRMLVMVPCRTTD